MLLMNANDKIRAEIKDFLKRTGIGPTRFGVLAVDDKTLMSRLKTGKGVSFETAERIRAFIRGYKPPARPKKRAAYQPAA